MIIDAPKPVDIPALKALWQEAFGDSLEFLDVFEKTAFSVDRSRCVKLDGSIAAALYWFDCSYSGGRIAYIYAVATAKAYRGRGLCSALMENTHRHLASLGYGSAILVPGSRKLFGFYERIGYRTSCHISEFHCFASDAKAELRQIDVDEYAELRRRYLPKNGIAQENENLNFLQTQAAFYSGEGFLLTARREKDSLYGVELLGDTAAAPDIVRAFGCREGRFRTPGNGRPFAMYLPFGDGNPAPPEYFGLAFD